MKLITKPRVYLVGSQQTDNQEINRFLESNDVEMWTTDTDVAGQRLVEISGRLCYMSFAKPRPGGNKAYIDHILEVGHGSVLEHAVFNLVIEGVSRSFTHELVRHRAGFAYSQLSQRFCDESEVPFVVHPGLAEEHYLYELHRDDLEFVATDKQDEAIALFQEYVETLSDIRAMYEKLSNYYHRKFRHIEDKTARRKAAREIARTILPNCTETKIFVTANARALRHFVEMRGNAAADAEIRTVACEVLRVLQDAAPNLFGDYEIAFDGSTTTPYRKV